MMRCNSRFTTRSGSLRLAAGEFGFDSGSGSLSVGFDRDSPSQEGDFDMLYLRVLNALPCYHQERP
jgi:hypothetical protein